MNKSLYLIKQSTTPNTLDLYIYDYVEGDSYDWRTDEKIESETSANYIQKQLESTKNVSNINIFVNSYGGEVKEGLAIYNQLKRHPAQKTVYVDGFACSIASVIAMAGDKVIMGNNTLMMIHHASMGAWGNAEELRKAANDVEIIDKASCSSYLAKAGDKLNEETLNQLLDNQTWLNAEQCLQYGLCDEIAGKEDDNISKAQQRFNQAIKQQIEGLRQQIEVPKQFNQNKTNAEKLMQLFKKKEGIK
ncbi:head maturation protease, ClpP-related [Clostridium botulinum]|uniref:head maturation protease, ClpP-related n=1 Tax=Clostridium botulinum TaxID=1491 RepID=UPI0004D60514|nr:head maturation protease, ClpP-related [Clostridium botulinum]KEI01572.1 peptidase S14 [Clostridium botulinum C/D str. BKT75002]KEI07906.1 peptidase S14 [Clostridium botulinum C/D str. BKT2873]QPW61569.1 ATP-dependent Clp protease proteolytic subunit [Clostridium botulinum]